MKFAPRHSQIIGRMVIRRSEARVILVDETKVTKFILIDAVGEDAAAAGLKPGDVVVPLAMGNVILDGGRSFRPVLEEKNVAFLVVDLEPNELLVQTHEGGQFVALDSDEAAPSLGASS